MLKHLISKKVNEIIVACQKANGITDGGIDPFDALYLDELEQRLEQHIARIIEYQGGGILTNETSLVGFVHQYGKDDFSIWSLQLTDSDEELINAILSKYGSRGYSVRGNSRMKLKEVL